MSIYIPNVSLPQYGHRISILSDGHAYYEDMQNPFNDLGEVISIPNHGRLIEEDAAYDKIAEEAHEDAGNYVDMDVVGRGLEYTPTIIPAEEDNR